MLRLDFIDLFSDLFRLRADFLPDLETDRRGLTYLDGVLHLLLGL